MVLTMLTWGLAKDMEKEHLHPAAIAPETARTRWCEFLPSGRALYANGDPNARPARTPASTFIICFDEVGNGVSGPAPWNRTQWPTPNTDIVVLVRSSQPGTVSVKGEDQRGASAPQTERLAPDASRGSEARLRSEAPRYHSVVNLHRYAPGKLNVTASLPGAPAARVREVVAEAIARSGADSGLDETAKAALTKAAADLGGRTVDARAFEAVQARLRAASLTADEAKRLAEEIAALPDPPVRLVELNVEAVYTGAVRVGLGADYTPNSGGYTVGAAAAAGGGELVVQEDEVGPLHTSLLVGFSQYLVPRPESDLRPRLGLTGGLSLVDYDGGEPHAVSFAYLGSELAWPKFGLGLFVSARRVETLRDGLAVGQALADNTQEKDIIGSGVAPGLGLVVYLPDLISLKKNGGDR